MRRITVLVSLVSLVVALAPIPGSAQMSEGACPVGLPDAGFTDVDPSSVHKTDIDCIGFWDISKGTTPTTFSPKSEVTRWQMALFLMRTFGWISVVNVDGSDQGFLDTANLPVDTQTAINQLKQLSITTGTSPTTFTPHGNLSRWEMALFLTRLLQAAGVALPGGKDQGFTDISALSSETQAAINDLKQLGITTGTTPTTFSPFGVVTREQMASFLARTLRSAQHDWSAYCAIDHEPTHVKATWRVNDVVLDGSKSNSLEWSEATEVFLPLQPAWGDPTRYDPCSTSMMVSLMNDDTYLYGLYYVPWGTFNADNSGGIALFRGEECCGVNSDFGSIPASELGEFSTPWDAYGGNEGQWLTDTEAAPPGTNDMEGVGSYDGSAYWFEWRKPLDSADGRDWVLEPGQTVGNVSTQTWFLVNFWEAAISRSHEHVVTMTLADNPG